MTVLLPRPDGNVRTAIEDGISAEQTLDQLLLHPDIDGVDRDIVVLRARGVVGAELASVLGVSKAMICERLAKMLALYHELEEA